MGDPHESTVIFRWFFEKYQAHAGAMVSHGMGPYHCRPNGCSLLFFSKVIPSKRTDQKKKTNMEDPLVGGFK